MAAHAPTRAKVIERIASAMILASAVGCMTPGANPLALSPANNLTKTAKEFRQSAPSPQQLPTELQKQPLPSYVVESGDTLRAETPTPDPDVLLPADQTVMVDGKIDLGSYGRVLVAGKTLQEAQDAVREAVQSKSSDVKELTLRLVGTESKTYFVLGAVNAPGEYPLVGRESVLNGIVQAGGLTNSGDVKKIILVRPTLPCDGRHVLPVCYREIVQLGDTSTNYQLLPGDRIFVPSRPFLEVLFPFLGSHKKCDPCDRPQSPAPAEQLICPTECATTVQ